MKQFAALLLLFGLLTALRATCQTTDKVLRPAQDDRICLPRQQANTLTDALRHYDVLRAAHQVQTRLVVQLTTTDSLRRRQVATLQAAGDSSARATQLLSRRLDVSQARSQLWQGRARRRGWLVAGLSTVLGSFVYLSLAP